MPNPNKKTDIFFKKIFTKDPCDDETINGNIYINMNYILIHSWQNEIKRTLA